MTDITPPDLASGIGRVRKYIPDLVQLEDPKDPASEPSYYFSDLEILGYLSEFASDPEKANRWEVRYAAADAIDALANNEALVLKKIKTEDLETDGPATANALRAGARSLRATAATEEDAAQEFVGMVPFRHHHPQTRMPWGFR